jgi:hypothetical protein
MLQWVWPIVLDDGRAWWRSLSCFKKYCNDCNEL